VKFLYHPESGGERLTLEGEPYNYLFKVRRQRVGDRVALRNLRDQNLSIYTVEEVGRRQALLRLVEVREYPVLPKRYFHLLWCIVDPKVVEKSLPSLNEIGVGKITFLYCHRSQRNFRLKLERLERLLINSCQQSGRSNLMELEIVEGLEEALDRYPDTVLLDFGGESVTEWEGVERLLIGPEGGVTPEERGRFSSIVAFDTPLVLRSETAAVAAASRVLL